MLGQEFVWHTDANDPPGSVELREGVPLSVYVEAKQATNEGGQGLLQGLL